LFAAVDAVFRELPIVAFSGDSRPMIRVDDYLTLVERSTFHGDRVRAAYETCRRRSRFPRSVPRNFVLRAIDAYRFFLVTRDSLSRWNFFSSAGRPGSAVRWRGRGSDVDMW
jgi:hypothetical protein